MTTTLSTGTPTFRGQLTAYLSHPPRDERVSKVVDGVLWAASQAPVAGVAFGLMGQVKSVYDERKSKEQERLETFLEGAHETVAGMLEATMNERFPESHLKPKSLESKENPEQDVLARMSAAASYVALSEIGEKQLLDYQKRGAEGLQELSQEVTYRAFNKVAGQMSKVKGGSKVTLLDSKEQVVTTGVPEPVVQTPGQYLQGYLPEAGNLIKTSMKEVAANAALTTTGYLLEASPVPLNGVMETAEAVKGKVTDKRKSDRSKAVSDALTSEVSEALDRCFEQVVMPRIKAASAAAGCEFTGASPQQNQALAKAYATQMAVSILAVNQEYQKGGKQASPSEFAADVTLHAMESLGKNDKTRRGLKSAVKTAHRVLFKEELSQRNELAEAIVGDSGVKPHDLKVQMKEAFVGQDGEGRESLRGELLQAARDVPSQGMRERTSLVSESARDAAKAVKETARVGEGVTPRERGGVVKAASRDAYVREWQANAQEIMAAIAEEGIEEPVVRGQEEEQEQSFRPRTQAMTGEMRRPSSTANNEPGSPVQGPEGRAKNTSSPVGERGTGDVANIEPPFSKPKEEIKEVKGEGTAPAPGGRQGEQVEGHQV